jgi:hypothetical protein
MTAVIVVGVIRRLTMPMGAMVVVSCCLLGAVVMTGPMLVIVTVAKTEALGQIASSQEQVCCDQQYKAAQRPSKDRFFSGTGAGIGHSRVRG